jgi:putative CocE/NonD family hydrolase
MTLYLNVIAALTLVVSASTLAADEPVPAPGNVALTFDLKIPMRDKVRLNATLYQARGASTVQPCVFTLTPYIAQSYHDRGMYFATHGYSFLTVDVRGRGNSEGKFRPMIQEAKDAHDTVEWLAKQPFCNGKITMWGGSYAGYDQWAAAKERPPHLATIVPVASPYAGVDFPMQRNIAFSYDMQWLTFTSGHASQSNIFGDRVHWASVYRELYLQHAPFRSLDKFAGNTSTAFQEWLAHPMVDAYWDAYNPSDKDYAAIDLPILSITGQYDGDTLGAFAHYRHHLANASAAARAKHFLIIGPWDHAGTRTPQAEFDGLKFGPASLLDMNDLHRQWYDWTMKDGTRPEFLKKQVAYYMIGPEQWRYADTLDGVTRAVQPWFLASQGGKANDAFASGTLVADKGGDSAPDSYVYDPLDKSPARFSEKLDVPELTDQRPVLDNRGGSLIYHTPPFADDTELGGFPSSARGSRSTSPTPTWMSSSTRSSLTAAACSSPATACARATARAPRAAKPGACRRGAALRVRRVHVRGRRIDKGSRIRMLVQPINSPYWQKNYNSGRRGLGRDREGRAHGDGDALPRRRAPERAVPAARGAGVRRSPWCRSRCIAAPRRS